MGNVAGGGIRRYLPNGTFDQTIGSDTVRIDWIDIDSSNDTILYSQEGTDIRRVVISDGSDPGNFTTGTATVAYCLRILHGSREGKVLLADGDDVKLYRPNGTVERTYDISLSEHWFSLDVNPDDSTFWAGDINSGIAYKFAIDSGNLLDTLDSGWGLNRLFGIAVFRGIKIIDVSVNSIPSPPDTVDCLDTVRIAARVCNEGDSLVIFDVEAVIPAFYGDTVFGVTLASGACTTLTFENWVVPDSHGVCFDLTFRTLLDIDMNHSNDTLSKQVCAFCPPPARHDVGSISIVSPPDTVVSGEIRSVIGTIFNFGDTTESFDVTFEILPGYSSTQQVTNLDPGDSLRVIFDDWNVPSPCDSSYSALVYTLLGNDADRSNDTMNREIFCLSVGVDEEKTHPIQYSFTLFQSKPNPFASRTEILYSLPKETQVSLEIYGLSGRLVRTLIHGREEAGVHRITWDGRDEERNNVGSGIYFYKLRTDRESRVRKLILIR